MQPWLRQAGGWDIFPDALQRGELEICGHMRIGACVDPGPRPNFYVGLWWVPHKMPFLASKAIRRYCCDKWKRPGRAEGAIHFTTNWETDNTLYTVGSASTYIVLSAVHFAHWIYTYGLTPKETFRLAHNMKDIVREAVHGVGRLSVLDKTGIYDAFKEEIDGTHNHSRP